MKMLLIVSRKKSHAATIAGMIRYSGIVCYPATTAEAFSEISTMYRAVIILDPDTLPDTEDFVKKLREYLSSIPVFALYSTRDFVSLPCFDASFTAATYSASLISKICVYCKAGGFVCAGDYRLAGINATPDMPDITFFDKPVKLSKTEAMILRFLMRSYPLPRKSKSIIKYTYKPTDAPEESSIRTHICSINKKFSIYNDCNLIKSIPNKGYVIYTPELREKYSL